MKQDEIKDINRLTVLTVKQATRIANVATGTLYRSKEGRGPAENISGHGMRGTSIITVHCAVRARQRGYLHADFQMVESIGTWTREGIFLRRRDVDSKLHRLSVQLRRKRREGKKGNDDREIIGEIERLQRLSGHALSIYRPSRRRLKRILRGRRMRGASKRYGR